jgi:hypothetical protein
MTRESKRPDPRYRYTTARLVSDLGISAAEQTAMRSLVAPEIASGNARTTGSTTRSGVGQLEACRVTFYVGRAAERASAAGEMARTGIRQDEIARRLGVNQSTVSRWLVSPKNHANPSQCIWRNLPCEEQLS